MSSEMNEVVEILQQQVINKTLNLEGINMVQDILEKNKNLEAEVRRLEELNANYMTERSVLTHKNATLQSKSEQDAARIKAYENQEAIFNDQSIRFEYEKARGNEMKEIVAMALRNPVITTSRFSTSTGYDAHGATSDSNTETIEKEII